MPGVGLEPTMLSRAAPFKGAGCANSPTRAGAMVGGARQRSTRSGIHPAWPKLFFIPVSIAAGLIAGSISRKIFDQLWGLVDEEEPPDSKHRDIPWSKLLLAGAIQGAIFRMVKESIDHGTRRPSTARPAPGRASRIPRRNRAFRRKHGCVRRRCATPARRRRWIRSPQTAQWPKFGRCRPLGSGIVRAEAYPGAYWRRGPAHGGEAPQDADRSRARWRLLAAVRAGRTFG